MYMEGQETDKTHCWFVPMTLEKRILDAPDKWREKSERGRHDGSKLFKWHTLTLSCCNMTFHSQLTVANSAAVDELLQGVLIALNCFKDVP